MAVKVGPLYISTKPVLEVIKLTVERAPHQKHPGIYFDEKLKFKMHIEIVLCKVNKRIFTIKKLRHTLPRKSLSIWKVFLRPHIDYGDVIYDQPSNESLR